MMTYSLDIDCGMHHDVVSTSGEDFYRWLNDLNSEYQMEYSFTQSSSDVPFPDCVIKDYYIINYYGDRQHVGAVCFRGAEVRKTLSSPDHG